jgi:hypothetical protein
MGSIEFTSVITVVCGATDGVNDNRCTLGSKGGVCVGWLNGNDGTEDDVRAEIGGSDV